MNLQCRKNSERLSKRERDFVDVVWGYYREHKRAALPWRKTQNPYCILVSEIMLQQTQVDRVVPKYKTFLKQFPTVQKLAAAPLGDVLMAWQGLGYNRRAKLLHECAQVVVHNFKGRFPRDFEALKALPGIGPYTAGAICAFAYDQAVPLIETNIRTVFIHHFFHDETDVSDSELVRYIALTMDYKHPREWYWALMDYGSYVKKTVGNLNTKSKHYVKQSRFQGSDRQIRGAIIRALSEESVLSVRKLHNVLKDFEDIRIDAQLQLLEEEGFIQKTKHSYSLAT